MTLPQQQLVKVEVEVCQTFLNSLRVQDFPAYVFYLTLLINLFIIDSILFCKKTYSSLANNLTLGRAKWQKDDHCFFLILCSLKGTQVQMNVRGFLIGKQVLLYYIEFTAAMLEKHFPYCKSSVGYYKRQYPTGSSFYRSMTGKSLMFLDP